MNNQTQFRQFVYPHPSIEEIRTLAHESGLLPRTAPKATRIVVRTDVSNGELQLTIREKTKLDVKLEPCPFFCLKPFFELTGNYGLGQLFTFIASPVIPCRVHECHNYLFVHDNQYTDVEENAFLSCSEHARSDVMFVLRARFDELESEVTRLMFAPNGEGALRAKSHFESLIPK